jgi:hypothetical protein
MTPTPSTPYKLLLVEATPKDACTPLVEPPEPDGILNPKPHTLKPIAKTLHYKAQSLNPDPYTLNHKP